ncbi:tetratricopeptide (TPR) repeat protein [Peptoniphilus olsenii]|uniref:Tetratricopeptide (TPR) repeat protein n=1 Tax=Peptoniphilus olsenii TaxID=411570 RepID=A0ABV2J9Y9_9FIRM
MDTSFRTLPTNIHFNPTDIIQIANAELIGGDFSMVIDVLNLSDEFIKSIEFAVKFKGQDKRYLFNEEEFYFKRIVNINPHSRYYLEPIPLDDRFDKVRAIDLYISSYETEKKEHVMTNQSFEQKLPVIPERKRQNIKNHIGDEIKTYGENHIDYWRCVCGAVNLKEDEECNFCNRNKSFVLNNLTEPLINAKMLNILETTNLGTLNEEEKLNRIKTHLTKTNLSKIAPTNDSIKIDRTNSNTKNSIPMIGGKKIFLSLIGVMILLILALFGIRSATKVRSEKNIEKANSLITTGEYTEALKIYENVNERGTSNLGLEIDALKKLINSNNHFERGMELMKQQKYINAAYNFKKVISEDKKNFTLATTNLTEIENITIMDAEKLSSEGKKEDALTLLNSYLDVVNDSARVTNLKKEIENDKKLVDDLNSKEEFEKKSSSDTPAVMAKRAENLMHNYKKVVTEKANLREEPSVNSNILRVLEKNTELYITETKIEGSERVWCYVEAKDTKTDEVFTGWISDKTLN